MHPVAREKRWQPPSCQWTTYLQVVSLSHVAWQAAADAWFEYACGLLFVQ